MLSQLSYVRMNKMESATGIAPVLSVRETVVLLLDDADKMRRSCLPTTPPPVLT